MPDHRPSARRRGYDAKWDKVRAAYLARFPLCEFCQDIATAVDHIVPLRQGGPRLCESNLRPVCRDCHAQLTANLRATGRNEMPQHKEPQ